jgi:CDP-diacylglycerol---glycerol-3-phosphate 3-phosphatidyltransferase
MDSLNAVLDKLRALVRGVMKQVAVSLNTLTGGKLSPNTVTITGLLAHLPIALLIATGHTIWAAFLLLIFGLFDSLDGALARLQKRDSAAGMLLDATTDRMKEIMLYTGAAYLFVALGRPYMATWAVVACGASLCVSYVKAKGETAVAKSDLSASEVNRLFQDGLGRFEIRMFVLLVGLLSGRVILAVIVIALLSVYTAFDRLIKISRKLA